MGIKIKHVDPDGNGVRHLRRYRAIADQSRVGCVKGVDDSRTDAVLVAQSDRLGALLDAGSSGGENVVGVKGRVIVIGNEIAAVESVLGALQPVGAADVLILVVRIG